MEREELTAWRAPAPASAASGAAAIVYSRESLEGLRRHGIDPQEILAADADLLFRAVVDHAAARLPNDADRTARYEAFVRNRLFREGALIVAAWLRRLEKNPRRPDVGCRLMLSNLLRLAGEADVALRLTDFLDGWGEHVAVSRLDIARLAIERGAVLVDLAERMRDREMWNRARHYVSLACARCPSEETDALRLRLWHLDRSVL